MGSVRLRVELGKMLRDDSEGSVDDEDEMRWRPACVRRSEDAGREVLRERSCRRVATVVDGGRDKGIAGNHVSLRVPPMQEVMGNILSPEGNLTNIVRDSSISIERTEASDEDLDERMVVKMWKVG